MTKKATPKKRATSTRAKAVRAPKQANIVPYHPRKVPFLTIVLAALFMTIITLLIVNNL